MRTIRYIQQTLTILLLFFMSNQMAFSAYTARVLREIPPAEISTLANVASTAPKAFFSQNFTIPYSQLEGEINQALKTKVASLLNKNGVEVCATVLCPDVHWEVSSKINFTFTSPGQPQLATFGSPTNNGVSMSMNTSAQVVLSITGRVWTEAIIDPLDEKIQLTIPLSIDMGASGKFKLYPVLQVVDPVKLVTTTDVKVTIKGHEYTLAKAGAVLGSTIGFTPLGIAIGGPGPLSVTMAIFGATAAADIVEQKVNDLISNLVTKNAQGMTELIEKRLNKLLLVKVNQANNFKNLALNTTVPGIGSSISQLQNQFGFKLDVRTATPSTDINVYLTSRFNPIGSSGKISGKLLLQKGDCQTVDHGMAGSYPMPKPGGNQANSQLEAGQSCNLMLPNTGINAKVFLGATPYASNLAKWKPIAASLNLKGNISATETHLSCEFELNGLPNAAILNIKANSTLVKHMPGFKNAYFMLAGNQLFDKNFKPVNNLEIVGDRKCGSSRGKGYRLNAVAALLNELKNCPQCGPAKLNLLESKILTYKTFLNKKPSLVQKILGSRSAIGNQAHQRLVQKLIGKNTLTGNNSKKFASPSYNAGKSAVLLKENSPRTGKIDTRLNSLNRGVGKATPSSAHKASKTGLQKIGILNKAKQY